MARDTCKACSRMRPTWRAGYCLFCFFLRKRSKAAPADQAERELIEELCTQLVDLQDEVAELRERVSRLDTPVR